ncbi:hypothetical protein ACH347_29800 [Saccharopolyspora sp. 5N102]|uniref:hypothetical protein n=1 Tax=Saccharopolyspora sp. 5N102 TaxID=3375155 RepID=UPI003796DCBA
MRQQDRALAVALRGAQWALDDAAYAIPSGEYNSQQCHELAGILEQLALVLRDRATNHGIAGVGKTIETSAVTAEADAAA